MFEIEDLMFLKAASGKKDENLLDYSDLVNKHYSGESEYNVRPENKIAVRSGADMVIDCDLQVGELDIRFYDKDGSYQSDYTKSRYHSGTKHFEFTVPEDSCYILPKWYRYPEALPVSELIAGNPVIKYA